MTDGDHDNFEPYAYNKEYQATPVLTLERQIMDVNVPKNEREWWASKEIEVLREEIRHNRQETCILIEQLDDEIEKLREREHILAYSLSMILADLDAAAKIGYIPNELLGDHIYITARKLLVKENGNET